MRRPLQARPGHRHRPVRRWAGRWVVRLWAAPWTLLGLGCGLLAWLGGASLQRHGGAIEVTGGRFGHWLAARPGACCAITLGHVILATDAATLATFRLHEQVHVRQYERWGPLFVPAYLVAGAWAWLCRRDAYRDNAFEREAYATQGCARPRSAGE